MVKLLFAAFTDLFFITWVFLSLALAMPIFRYLGEQEPLNLLKVSHIAQYYWSFSEPLLSGKTFSPNIRLAAIPEKNQPGRNLMRRS
jgi:hypothetical protein